MYIHILEMLYICTFIHNVEMFYMHIAEHVKNRHNCTTYEYSVENVFIRYSTWKK
jgi:hypothetical protein